MLLRVVLGLACLATTAGVAVARWSTLLAGHPAYPVLLGTVFLTGAALLAASGRVRPATLTRTAARIAGALVLVGVLAAVVWLLPRPADAVAIAAATPSSTVDVASSPTTWELRPARPSGAGVVFYPGALVDPRAYLALLRPLAEQGHLVVVVKPPMNLALLAPATAPLDTRPAITRWIVGGHSLGGVAAARAAGDRRVDGIFFWASYPASDLSDATVRAISIFGERDGLTTPADVEASRVRLPPDTVLTEVPGAVHAFFGDYGTQPGDGVPTTDRATAQRQIVDTTGRFVNDLA